MRKWFVFCLIYLTGFSLIAIDWPESGKHVESGFGPSGKYHFNRAVELIAEEEVISPLDTGSVLYVHNNEENVFALPWDTGKAVAVSYESLFCSLNYPVDLSCSEDSVLSEESELATIENEDKRYYLTLFDTKTERLINPYNMLPDPGWENRLVISKVFLKNPEKEIQMVTDWLYNPGYYSIWADFENYHSPESHVVSSPYRISAYYLGGQTTEYSFDALYQKEGTVFLEGESSLTPSSLLDDQGRYFLGDIYLNSGKGIFDIVIASFYGAEETRQYHIVVE